MSQPTTATPPVSPSATPAPWRERTLDRLVQHVRAVLPVSAVVFVTAEGDVAREGRPAAWYASGDLKRALEASMTRLLRGHTLLLPRVEAWQAAPELKESIYAALDQASARQVWEAFRGASVIVCPVRGETGTRLGALVVASLDHERPLGSDQLPPVEALADLAAIALERTTLLEAEGRRARDELRLMRAAEAVSESLDPADVYVRVARHAAAISGATSALLTRLSTRSGEVRTAATVDCSEELAAQLASLDSAGFAHVARTRTALLRNGPEAAPLGSVMHAPIELGPRLYGVLTVGHEDVDRFGEDDLELLVKLARLSAAAIANAIDYQRERRIARALTLGFVPESLPAMPGYETGLLYAPAANEPTGGDVYGAWPVGRGDSVAVLVGDVAGKGVETAALSAMVRFFIEARSWDTLCPARVLEQANSMLLGRLPPDTFVTAFLGVLSRDSLSYCNAGHLPPLHVRAGSASALDGHGLPLGVVESPEYESAEVLLDAGDLVLAYTDGLVEARRAGEMYGAARLAELVAAVAGESSPQELVRAVHEDVAGWADGISDDAVALALRRAAVRSA
ncbi:MAG TPA: GAF domain-containing SpoIIE family protein phosphatase [Thermoleophilaceae bacterium]|nr:GAF domain-containing SpoIIE family protein phosphatase [Thermoleophilaceae bacterium]